MCDSGARPAHGSNGARFSGQRPCHGTSAFLSPSVLYAVEQWRTESCGRVQSAADVIAEATPEDAMEFEELCDTWSHLRPTVASQIASTHQDPVRVV